MRDDFRQALQDIATHPATFGLAAAIARWTIGDRVGGVKSLLIYATCSLFVAWAGAFYLADELGMTVGRKNVYLLLLAFVAKDVLTALAGIAAQFRVDPLGVLARIRESLTGGPKT